MRESDLSSTEILELFGALGGIRPEVESVPLSPEEQFELEIRDGIKNLRCDQAAEMSGRHEYAASIRENISRLEARLT